MYRDCHECKSSNWDGKFDLVRTRQDGVFEGCTECNSSSFLDKGSFQRDDLRKHHREPGLVELEVKSLPSLLANE